MDIRKMGLSFGLFMGILLPVVLWALPKTYFDEGESVCLSVLLLGVECPACGLTRAGMRLIHGDIMGAYYFNKMSLLAVPLLAWIWLRTMWAGWLEIKKPSPKERL